MKTIIFPKEMDKILRTKTLPTSKLGLFKPHQIYHVLDYKRRSSHTYIEITRIYSSKVKYLPKFFRSMPEFKSLSLDQRVEILHFQIVYQDEFTEEDEHGNIIPKVFN